jgi:hypothetical protein
MVEPSGLEEFIGLRTVVPRTSPDQHRFEDQEET